MNQEEERVLEAQNETQITEAQQQDKDDFAGMNIEGFDGITFKTRDNLEIQF